jgi:hypothetical protein
MAGFLALQHHIALLLSLLSWLSLLSYERLLHHTRPGCPAKLVSWQTLYTCALFVHQSASSQPVAAAAHAPPPAVLLLRSCVRLSHQTRPGCPARLASWRPGSPSWLSNRHGWRNWKQQQQRQWRRRGTQQLRHCRIETRLVMWPEGD